MTQPSKATKNPPKRSGAGFGILLSLLIATAAAIGSYWTWQQSNIRDEAQNSLENGVSQLLEAIEKQREDVTQRFNLEQQQRQNYQALQRRLIALESKFEQANQPPKAGRWTVAEALYLINIAEHHYRLEQNSSMARSALEQARKQLLEHHSTITATDALSQIIAQLEAQDDERRAQQMSQLATLSTLIPQLPIIKNSSVVALSSNTSSDYSLESMAGWRHYGEALWHDIQQLFRISRPDAPSSERGHPITADIYPLLRQQLLLKIDLTRLALMSNSPLYISTVKEIMTLLNHYFDSDNAMVKEQLTILKQWVSREKRQPDNLDFDSLRQQLTSINEPSGSGQ